MAKKIEKSPGVETAILAVRGVKVILDADLAQLYGVSTKRLNEQVRRNTEKFPPDFVFQLTAEEVVNLKSQIATGRTSGMWSQIATTSVQLTDVKEDKSNRPQFATGSQKHRDPRFLPYAFTEHGAIMAATILNSPQAVQMSVFVVRAFVKMREQLLGRAEMEKRLAEIEKVLLSHDSALRDLYQKIRPLLLPPPEPPKKQIGFQVKERAARYAAKKGC